MPDSEQNDLARLTVDLLSAYFANNSVPSSELSGLIEQTRSALAGGTTSPSSNETVYTPAVSIEESTASRDHILSLVDGKPYKSLKRHLANHGLTPAEYRTRYGLPGDYPMVAPSYSEHRRAVAQRMGLGGRPNKEKASAAKTVAQPVAQAKEAPVKEAAPKPAAAKTKTSAEKKDTVKAVAAAKPRKRFAREPKAAVQGSTKVTSDAAVQTSAALSSEAPKAKASSRKKTTPAAKGSVPLAGSPSSATAPASKDGKKVVAPTTASSGDATATPSTAKKPKSVAGKPNAQTASRPPRPRRVKKEAANTPGK